MNVFVTFRDGFDGFEVGGGRGGAHSVAAAAFEGDAGRGAGLKLLLLLLLAVEGFLLGRGLVERRCAVVRLKKR